MTYPGKITLSVDDGPAVDVPRVITTLSRELARDGVTVSRDGGAAPEGSKSANAVTIGSLVISGAVSVAAIRSVTRIVLAAMQRGLAGKIRLEDGERTLELENATRDTERALVDWLTAAAASAPPEE